MLSLKKKRKTKAAAVILSLCALGCTAIMKPAALFREGTAITAYASDFSLSGCNFVVSENRCILTEYTGSASSLTLPISSSFPTDRYTYEVGPQVFKNNSTLTSLTVPSGYTFIGDQAFYSCQALQSLNLENAKTLTKIRNQAFAFCPKLKTVDMTNATKLSETGYAAFFDCRQLTSVLLPTSGIKTISCGSFEGCTSLSKIEIPDSVTSIEANAFSQCSHLSTLKGVNRIVDSQLLITYFPDTKIEAIGASAFSGTALTTVTLPSTIKDLYEDVFSNCTRLTQCDLKYTTIKTIPNGFFSNCSSLEKVWIPSTLTTIGNYAFQNCSRAEGIQLLDTSTTCAVNLTTGKYTKLAAASGNWYDVFTGVTKLILGYRMNNKLCLTAGDINADVWTNRPAVSDIPVKVQLNFKDESIGIFDDMTYRKNEDNYATFEKLVVGLPIPVPGKVYSAAKIKLSDTVVTGHKACDLFTLNWVKCYDVKTGRELAEGSRFQCGTNYYFKFSVTTKSDVFLNFAEYLNGKISYEHADAESAPLTNKTSYNGMPAKEIRGVNTTLASVSGGCTSQTLVFNAGVRLNNYLLRITDNSAPSVYPYKDCVTETVAGTINGKNRNITTNVTSLFYTFKEPDPVRTLSSLSFDPLDYNNNPGKGYLFDQNMYYGVGAPNVQYGFKKAGTSNPVTWLWDYDFTNLETDTLYDIYFSDHTASNFANAVFYTGQFRTNAAMILKSASLSLEGEIGLQFGTELTPSMRGAGASAKFKYPTADLTSSNYRTQSANWKDGDVFTCWLAAKQVYDPVTLYAYKMPNGDTANWSLCGGRISNVLKPREYTYSIAKYVDAINASSASAKMKNLSLAVRNYGIFAQRYFDYHTSLIPAADFDAAIDSISNISAADLAPYAAQVSGTKPAGLASGSASFVCESSSELRLNLTFSGVAADDFTYTIDGQNTRIRTEGSTTYLALSNIMAKDLDKFHTFTISRGGKTLTLKACGLTYAQGAISGTDIPLKNLSKALYNYNQAAKAYFAN